MLSVSIQFFTLLAGLLVNFVVPALYGLETYGAFIQANILVFVFHKLTDIINEPLIGQTEPDQVFPLAVITAVAIWLLFLAVNQFTPLGSPLLLASMLVSACVTLALYSLRWQRVLLTYLLGFIALFFALIALKTWAQWSLDIVDILAWTNGLVALPLLIPLAQRAHWRSAGRLARYAMRAAPGNASATLVFNLLTNLLPYLLSKILSHADLGLFRVMTSVVQSVGSLFPVNAKAVFVMFRRHDDAATLLPRLLGFALLWFAGIGLAGLTMGMLYPRLLPFLGLVAALPVLYWAMLGERYLLAEGSRRTLILINLGVGGLTLLLAWQVDTLTQATILYATSIATYALGTLLLAGRGTSMPWAVWPIAVLMPFAVYLQGIHLPVALLWQGVIMALAWWSFKLSFADIRHLGVRL